MARDLDSKSHEEPPEIDPSMKGKDLYNAWVRVIPKMKEMLRWIRPWLTGISKVITLASRLSKLQLPHTPSKEAVMQQIGNVGPLMLGLPPATPAMEAQQLPFRFVMVSAHRLGGGVEHQLLSFWLLCAFGFPAPLPEQVMFEPQWQEWLRVGVDAMLTRTWNNDELVRPGVVANNMALMMQCISCFGNLANAGCLERLQHDHTSTMDGPSAGQQPAVGRTEWPRSCARLPKHGFTKRIGVDS
jgi:hypothetical protein